MSLFSTPANKKATDSALLLVLTIIFNRRTLYLPFVCLAFTAFAQKDQAYTTIDSLKKEITHAQDDTGKVILLDMLSYRYSTIDVDEGLKAGNQTLQLAEQLKWERGIALANNEISINNKEKGNYTEALAYAQKALKIYEELNDENGKAAVLANIVLIYLSHSNFSAALDYSFDALRIYERHGDKLRMAMVMENVGTIYLEQKNYDKALKYYREAYGIYNNQGNKESIARNQSNMGVVLQYAGAYDSALLYHRTALKTNEEMGYKSAMQMNIENIGNIYLHKNNFPEALKYLKQALDISKKTGIKRNIAVCIGNLGETYYAIANDSTHSVNFHQLPVKNSEESLLQSVKLLQEAISMCWEIHYAAPELEFMQNLSEAYALLGNHKESLEIYKQYIALRDSVFSDQNKINMATLESQRELKIKEDQLRIKELELIRGRYERIAYAVIIVISCIILFYFIRRFNLLRISNNKLRIRMLRTEDELVNSEFRLRQAQAVAHFGNWTMSGPSANETVWSEELCRIFGVPENENHQTIESWLSFIHPDDVNSVVDLIQEAGKEHNNTSFFYRIIKKDGNIRHLHSQAYYEYNKNGEPIGMYGVAHDITEMKKNEDELSKSNETFKLINLASREAIFVWDIINDTTVWGEGFTEIFGYQPHQYHNHLLSDNIYPEDASYVHEALQKTLADPTNNQLAIEFRYLTASRKIAYVTLRSIFVRDENGKPLRAIAVLMDITALAEKNYMLEKQNAALIEVAWIQSHVIRAPLASLMGLMTLLKHREQFGVTEQEVLNNMEKATSELDSVIHEIVKKAELVTGT